MTNYYVKGANNVWCQLCAKKLKSYEAKRRYDNLILCKQCWNPKHPREYPPIIRPDVAPVLVAPPPPERDYVGCELFYTQGVPGRGRPGCWIIGRNFGQAIVSPDLPEPTNNLDEDSNPDTEDLDFQSIAGDWENTYEY